jgi:tyrosyl-tRNA synthetase
LAAEETARKTFEEGTIAVDLPTVELSGLGQGVGILTAFVLAGLVTSTSEARRQIRSGGLRVNDVPVTDERASLSAADLTEEGVVKLSIGRKRHVLAKSA